MGGVRGARWVGVAAAGGGASREGHWKDERQRQRVGVTEERGPVRNRSSHVPPTAPWRACPARLRLISPPPCLCPTRVHMCTVYPYTFYHFLN